MLLACSPVPMNENPYQAPAPAFTDLPGTSSTIVRELFTFRGRATRLRYWLTHLGSLAMLLACLSLSAAVEKFAHLHWGYYMLLPAFILHFWLSICVVVRRFHDRNKSGAWAFILLFPYIGGMWVFIDCGILEGTPGPNQYGPDPLRKTML